MFPCPITPEVVCPEKATSQEVGSQIVSFLGAESCCSDIGHENEWVVEQLIVGESYYDMVGSAPFVTSNFDFGELLEAAHEVDIGTGIICVPPLTIPFAAYALVHDAREDKTPVQ